ncbi:uncharacterized protein LOC119726795 [Patiria miniata]|uniref:PHD-type domain-containing protein n=1 Tax=Patiria miniata TaxID=46514 RepID=A0A913ZU29_PATMI|nr:uncharacterized protein LOC119726795 [Patiria miniata]
MVKTLEKTSCDVPSTSLRLAPPQGRRLPVFHRQCANQLVHADCVLVLGEQRFQRVPCSHWEGTGASVPFSWINLEKRCTDNMRLHEIKQREYEQKLIRKYDLKLRAYEYNHRAYEFNLRYHIDDTEPRCSDYLVQRRRVSELKMRRINKMTKQRVSNQKALRSLKVSRQTCCSRSQVLESYVEYCQEAKKVSKPNRKKMRRSQRRQAFHRMRNGKMIKLRMSKEDRRNQKNAQKNLQSHTRRSLSYVLNNMPDKGDKCIVKKHSRNQYKPWRSQKSKFSKRSNVNEIQDKQCWLCDRSIKSSKNNVQCDGCDIWYHVHCMNFSKMKQVLSNKAVTWLCRKCGKSTYSESLLCNLGIPTDDNLYDLTVQETCTDDVVRERSVSGMCRKDSNKDNQRKNNLCMCDVDVIEEKTTPLLETDYWKYLHS